MTGPRRALVQAVVTALALAVAGPSPAQDGSGETSAALVLQAEADLAQGEVSRAIESLERATRMGHEAAAEMGLVRAYMQDGQYRRALAFCAHVAGEHRDAPGAAVLYAALLRAGGQEGVAKTVLAQIRTVAPADLVVLAAVRAFDAPAPLSEDELLRSPHRLAPFDSSMGGLASIPRDAIVASTGVLLADGVRVIVPASRIIGKGNPVARLWVRDGLGRTREADIDVTAPVPAMAGAAVLRLRQQLGASADTTFANRPPFAGSPGYVVGYAEGRPAGPAWPRLQAGFFAAGVTLRIDTDAPRDGSAVLDAAGHIVGIVLREAGHPATILPVALWPSIATADPTSAHSSRPSAVADAAPRRFVPADEVYEHALPIVLQVLTAP